MFVSSKIALCVILAVLIKDTTQEVKDPELLKKLEEYGAACSKEIGVSKDDVKKAFTASDFPDDTKLKCYLKCVNIKLGVMDDDGNINTDALGKLAVQFGDANKSEDIISQCGKIEESDPCEAAFKLITCAKNAKTN